MAAITYNPTRSQTATSRRGGFPWLLLIVLAAVVVGLQYSHAVARHGSDAADAARCFDQHGNVMRWYNPFRDTYILVCQEAPGEPVYLRVVRMIRGKVEELTRYRKDNCYWLEDIAKVLEDQGAVLQWVKP